MQTVGDRYVAFVDLLGFSDFVQNNWEKAHERYLQLTGLIEQLHKHATQRHRWQGRPTSPDPELHIVSDSIVVVGEDLWRVLDMVQAAQSAALLSQEMLVRGSVAFGKHAHEVAPNRFSVVSVPLVLAVAGEKAAHYPRVTLDRASVVEEKGRSLMLQGHGVVMPCDDGLLMVQPFIVEEPNYTLETYGERLSKLEERYKTTRHSTKWSWMASLVEKVEGHLDALMDLAPDYHDER